MSAGASWQTASEEDAAKALDVYPLDEHNASLLDAVHPRAWADSSRPDDFVYDIIAIGAGAGGLVTSKQAAIYSVRLPTS